MNQSELEAIKCSRRQARENMCDQVTIGFGLVSHWLKSGAGFVNQSQSAGKHNQSNYQITFDTQLKTAQFTICYKLLIAGHLRRIKKNLAHPIGLFFLFLFLIPFS